ncbi:MAG TPA: hypothetical protein VJ488_00815 [Dehalococcoidia bacterium]|nr:hypothetical protein [Dehalococcoidia bacterium]
MGEDIKTEKELQAEGWQLATVTGGTHLKRTMDMYAELNIPTYLFQVDPHQCGECIHCFITGKETAYRVYIKPQAE